MSAKRTRLNASIVLLVTAAAFVIVRALMQWLGLDAHASVLAGMPQSEASWVLGPLYVVVQLLAAVVSPVLVVAAVISVGLGRALRAADGGDRRLGGEPSR